MKKILAGTVAVYSNPDVFS